MWAISGKEKTLALIVILNVILFDGDAILT